MSLLGPMLRIIILIILALATAAWLWVAVEVLTMRDGDTGLGVAALIIPGAAFLVFALPAFLLAIRGRHLGVALSLALLSIVSAVLVF
jgi:hypothetical protein